jgi:hypothetical protein
MSNRTVFLVYGFDCYEYPYDPIKAFASKAAANVLLAEIAAHESTKPQTPGNECTDEEFDTWEKQHTQWCAAHPAGEAWIHDGFNVIPLEFVEAAND